VLLDQLIEQRVFGLVTFVARRRIRQGASLRRNAIESLNGAIRKSIETRGSFPTEDAAARPIFLAIHDFEKAGRNVGERFAARHLAW